MSRERQFRGANDLDVTVPRATPDAASSREPGRQTLVEATLASSVAGFTDRPGARTLTEALPALDVENPDAFASAAPATRIRRREAPRRSMRR